jgi:hypothetical protein
MAPTTPSPTPPPSYSPPPPLHSPIPNLPPVSPPPHPSPPPRAPPYHPTGTASLCNESYPSNKTKPNPGPGSALEREHAALRRAG